MHEQTEFELSDRYSYFHFYSDFNWVIRERQVEKTADLLK